jgi:hypothetical protein
LRKADQFCHPSYQAWARRSREKAMITQLFSWVVRQCRQRHAYRSSLFSHASAKLRSRPRLNPTGSASGRPSATIVQDETISIRVSTPRAVSRCKDKTCLYVELNFHEPGECVKKTSWTCVLASARSVRHHGMEWRTDLRIGYHSPPNVRYF